MKAVVQRVLQAEVRVDGRVVGSLPRPGLLVYLGVAPSDGTDELLDAQGRMRPVWRPFIDHFARLTPDDLTHRFARGNSNQHSINGLLRVITGYYGLLTLPHRSDRLRGRFLPRPGLAFEQQQVSRWQRPGECSTWWCVLREVSC